jgi:hypothetical protein
VIYFSLSSTADVAYHLGQPTPPMFYVLIRVALLSLSYPFSSAGILMEFYPVCSYLKSEPIWLRPPTYLALAAFERNPQENKLYCQPEY